MILFKVCDITCDRSKKHTFQTYITTYSSWFWGIRLPRWCWGFWCYTEIFSLWQYSKGSSLSSCPSHLIVQYKVKFQLEISPLFKLEHEPSWHAGGTLFSAPIFILHFWSYVFYTFDGNGETKCSWPYRWLSSETEEVRLLSLGWCKFDKNVCIMQV